MDHLVPVRLRHALLIILMEYLRVLIEDGARVGIILNFQLRCQLCGNGGPCLGTFRLCKAILVLGRVLVSSFFEVISRVYHFNLFDLVAHRLGRLFTFKHF